MTRILITGSRHWAAEDDVWSALQPYAGRQNVTVVHGACPTGADAIADTVARRLGLNVERYPADWSLGKKADPLRNQQMVDLGADICYAFVAPDSRGTVDCIRRAEAAGIKIVTFKE